MFQALNYYSSSLTAANSHIDGATLQKMFTNTGNPFVDISTSTISVVGASLNSSDVQLRNIVASSKSATEAEAVRTKIESLLPRLMSQAILLM
jgi:FlaG/FlaF family flagellin (archaellin)